MDRVYVLDLFPEERAALLELLSGLAADDWSRLTVCQGWDVKDVAAHLLADDFGRLSRGRDAFAGAIFTASSPEAFERELLAWINRQNEAWVAAARRLSPPLLIDLLRLAGEQTQAYFASVDMDSRGTPVSWAGEESSAFWFDLAREYTERWIHQSQMRDAVGAPGLMQPRLFVPMLNTLVRAMPHTMRALAAADGTHVKLTVRNGADYPLDLREVSYSLIREPGGWSLQEGLPQPADASVEMDADTAWRLFSKGLSKAEAQSRAHLTGDLGLCEKIFETVAIIA